MKKALALVLALVLALSMAVSAFGLTYVTLVPDVTPEAAKTVITNSVVFTYDETKKVNLVNSPAGGVYYEIVNLDNYANVTVSATGNATAELVNYDPKTMVYKEGDDAVLTYTVKKYVGKTKTYETVTEAELTAAKLVAGDITRGNDYDLMVERAEALEMANENTNFRVVPDQNVKLVKITVASNYTAHFTEGTVTIKAVGTGEGETVKGLPYAAKTTIINDVIIFGYEYVKTAAKYYDLNDEIAIGVDGYSDYETYKAGYDQADLSTVLTKEGAVVVSTTAFRAIEGKNLAVNINNGDAYVVIDGVEAGQKGVNFTPYGYEFYDAKGKEITDPAKVEGNTASIKFGFYGDQVINGDFSIAIAPAFADGTAMTWFQLREIFGIKVEEDDIVSYYLLKDGKLVKEYKIDYMTIDYAEDIELELDLKDTTLGQYSLVLEVPASEAAGESNPNTGAESVVGVVAALAVVSLASAAAVSLKK